MFWKNYRKKNDVFSVIQLVYIAARAFGYWPFSIEFNDKSSGGRVRVLSSDLVWFAVALAIYCACNWLSVFNHLVQEHESYMEMATSQLFQFSNLLITTVSIIMDMVNRDVIWRIILKFNKFDDEVSGPMLVFQSFFLMLIWVIFR